MKTQEQEYSVRFGACLRIARNQRPHTSELRIVLAFVLVAVISLSLPAVAQTVILTRHAEKAVSPAENPPLNAAGMQRAKLLSDMLSKSGVTAIYVTEALRTQQTAQPLANATHIEPKMLPAADIDGLVKAVRANHKGVIVIVNHSNRIPEIIKQLGGPALTINEADYDNLFVMTLEDKGAVLLPVRYGLQMHGSARMKREESDRAK